MRENIMSPDNTENTAIFHTSANANPSMNDKQQMFRAKTMLKNEEPQMFHAMTSEESAMVQALMMDNPQMFRDMTNDDRTLVRAMINDKPQMFRAVTNGDPLIIQAMVDKNPQMFQSNENSHMFRVLTNKNQPKFRESADANSQLFQATSNNGMRTMSSNSPQTFQEMNNPQSSRVMTNNDQDNIHAIIDSQMFRALTDEDYFEINDNGMTFLEQLPDDFLNFQAINDENEFRSPSTIMFINTPNENIPDLFRGVQQTLNRNLTILKKTTSPENETIAPVKIDGFLDAPTAPDDANFKHITPEPNENTENQAVSNIKISPTPVEARESTSNNLNGQLMRSDSEIPKKQKQPTLSINGTISDLQKAINRSLSSSIKARKFTSNELKQLVRLINKNFVFTNLESNRMTEDESSMIENSQSSNPTEVTPEKQKRPTLSINGTISDLQKAINRSLSSSVEARESTSYSLSQSDFKPTSMFCITLNNKDLPQVNFNLQRIPSSEDISSNLDSNNTSNNISSDHLRSQTFITDADLMVPLDNNNNNEAVYSNKFLENEIQQNVIPIRILSPPTHYQPNNNIEIKHIPHVTPVHVISHENNFGNQDYNQNTEARTIIKKKFVTTNFVSPTSSIHQFSPSFHQSFPTAQTFSQSSASTSSFQNGGGFHRGFLPSSGSSASAFAQSSGVSQQPFFNGFRSNNGSNNKIISENTMDNISNRNSNFGIQPTIKAFRSAKIEDEIQDDKIVKTPNNFSPLHQLRKRSISQNITSNSLIPIVKGIEDLIGDQNATKNLLKPLKLVEDFLEKHTINENIQFENDKNGEPIIKTEFSTNFNPQELFTELEEELPKINRTKRTLALIHLLTKPSALNNNLVERRVTSTEDKFPPIIHLRDALGSASRAAMNMVESPLVEFILPRSFIDESSLGDSSNPNSLQRLNENRQNTMNHYQNAIQSLGNAIQAQRQIYIDRRNNSPMDNTEVNVSQMAPSESAQDAVIENIPTSQQIRMIIRPIGRSFARTGIPTKRMFFIAEPFHTSQVIDPSNLMPPNTQSFNSQLNPIRKPNKKFKKINRQPTKYESNFNPNKNVMIGSNFEDTSAKQTNDQNVMLKDDSNINGSPKVNLTSINPATTGNNDKTEINVMSTNQSERSSNLSDNDADNLITISQCKEMHRNGDIKVKREKADDSNDSETVGTIKFTEVMKKPFGGLATQEEINNYISNTDQDI